MTIGTVGVVGAGAMGRGIAQVAAVAGLEVRLTDSRAEAVDDALGFIAGMLKRAKGNILHRRLERVSPLAVPILLEIGKERVEGDAIDLMLDEAAQELIAEATERTP